MTKRLPGWSIMLASVGVLLLLGLAWQVAAHHQLMSRVFFPAPSRSLQSLWNMFGSAAFWLGLYGTLTRFFFGFALATVGGIVLGAIIGLSPRVRAYLEPTLEFIRPLPASAIVPVFIILFGLTDFMIVATIVFAALFPVLLNTVHGFKTINPRQIEVARALQLSRAATIWKIALPSATPDILAGMRLSVTVSLILVLVAEMLTGLPGIGRNITVAARSFRTADLYANLIVLAAIGYTAGVLLDLASNRLLRWRTGA